MRDNSAGCAITAGPTPLDLAGPWG